MRVAPYTGARIETVVMDSKSSARSVAPYTGARIETRVRDDEVYALLVAPYTGARIETWNMEHQGGVS